MVAEGCMVGVTDGVFGFHNDNSMPLGLVWAQPGVATSHCCDFEIVVTGKGGHASMPHLCKDPLLAASHIVVALNNVVSRRCACFALLSLLLLLLLMWTYVQHFCALVRRAVSVLLAVWQHNKCDP